MRWLALCVAVAALLAFFHGGVEICTSLEKTMRRRQTLLNSMNRRFDQDNSLWAYVRSRLEVCALLHAHESAV